MSELLLKVGDSGGYRDGDIIAIKPDGWLISPSGMATWLKDGKEPMFLATMPLYIANGCRRRVLAIRWKRAHTAAEVEAEYGLSKGAGEMEKAEADRDAAEFEATGLDTNWGTSDLKVHAVVRVADLTEHDTREFLDRDWVNDHTHRTLGKVCYRLPYANVLAPEKVADMQDKTKRVDVDRTLALSKTVIQPAARVVEKA